MVGAEKSHAYLCDTLAWARAQRALASNQKLCVPEAQIWCLPGGGPLGRLPDVPGSECGSHAAAMALRPRDSCPGSPAAWPLTSRVRGSLCACRHSCSSNHCSTAGPHAFYVCIAVCLPPEWPRWLCAWDVRPLTREAHILVAAGICMPSAVLALPSACLLRRRAWMQDHGPVDLTCLPCVDVVMGAESCCRQAARLAGVPCWQSAACSHRGVQPDAWGWQVSPGPALPQWRRRHPHRLDASTCRVRSCVCISDFDRAAHVLDLETDEAAWCA